MFGHRSWVIVLRINELLQSVESSVPTNHVPKELKQTVILRREMGDKGW